MATHPARRGWSYAEFARLPDDGNRYEVIDGELFVTPSPRPAHQVIARNLVELLSPFVRRHKLGGVYPGPIDVLFGPGDYLVPDLVFVRQQQRGTVTERGVESPPDLVVEILSPSTANRDRGLKRERYAHFGVPEYWVIDPRLRRIEIYRAGEERFPILVSSGSIVWQPVPGGPQLDVQIDDVFSDD